MKKNFLILSGLGILSTAAIAVGAVNGGSLNNLIKVGATDKCSVCSGHHHAANPWFNKTKNNDGHYEYWRCCQCHNFYLSTDEIPGYDAAKWEYKANDTDCPFDYTDYTDRRIQFGGLTTVHNVNKLESGTIAVDGQRDAAYDKAVKENFSTNVLWSLSGAKSAVTATIETLWQGTMFYAYVDVYDPTKQTRDFSKQDTTVATWDDDCVELRIDTLHSAKYATDTWDGQMGPNYRSGYACEGFFKVAAGYQREEQYGDGIGCDFDLGGYMSHLSKGDGKTYVKSYYKDNTHYGAEFAISLTNEHSIMNPFNEIGIAVKIYDKNLTGGQDGIICFEDLNDGYTYARQFSNFRLIGYGE